MAIPSVRHLDVADRKVLVRVDFNVPINDGVISDDTRIQAALPTIADILDRGGAAILVSHLGRPDGKVKDSLRLGPVANRLSELLGSPVKAVSDVVGQEAQQASRDISPGQVMLLENVRFEPGEEVNDPDLARALAALADLYVNDAFGAAHRAHASTAGVAAHLPSAIGYLMQQELESLGKLLDNPERPFVAILGGAKVKDKVGVIRQLIERVDALLLGGGIASTFAFAEGREIGKSLADRDFAEEARTIQTIAANRGIELLTPLDVIVAESMDSPGRVVPVEAVGAEESIFDIGPGTVTAYAAVIQAAGTIFWNGPMGVFEKPEFAQGTLGVAKAVADAPGFSVVGGGDSVAAIEQAGLADKIDHISTGGGASLEFLEGRDLPGVAAVREGRRQ